MVVLFSYYAVVRRSPAVEILFGNNIVMLDRQSVVIICIDTLHGKSMTVLFSGCAQ